MQFCLNMIKKLIDKQVFDTSGNHILININGFDSPLFYDGILEKALIICAKNDLDLIFKISDQKYYEHRDANEHLMNNLYNNDFVANGEKFTHFRNLIPTKKTLIILIGTDMSQDSNSLEDFFSINLNYLDNYIGTKYHLLFEKYGEILSDEDNLAIDGIYRSLFLYAPKNLLKLSNLVDEIPDDINNASQLIEYIFNNLYYHWNFVNIYTHIPSKRVLTNTNRINPIINFAIRFLRRKDYDTVSKISKAEHKIDKYLVLCNEDNKTWNYLSSFLSFEEFGLKLKEYINGINIDENRRQLSTVDFGLIYEALGVKLESTAPSKKYKFFDAPIFTISKALINFLSKNQDKFTADQKVEIIIDFNAIGLRGVSGFEEISTLWNKICMSSGGLIEFFNENLLKGFGDQEIELKWENDKDLFNPKNINDLYDDGILRSVSSSQKCKIEFELIFRPDGGKGIKDTYYWIFDDTDDWVVMMQDLNDDMATIVSECKSFIPFGYAKEMDNLYVVKNYKEFTERYDKKKIKYLDLVDIFKSKYSEKYNDFYAKYFSVGMAFCDWFKSVTERGFYHSILDSTVNTLTTAYTNYGKELSKNNLTEEFKQGFKLYLNAFLVCDCINPIKTDVEISKAICPPYHPATLEKVTSKNMYIIWGLSSILKGIGKYSEKQLYDQVLRLNQLSTINSAIDVLVTNGNKLLTSQNAFGYYVTYANKELIKNVVISAADMFEKEVVYSDEFKPAEYKELTPIARILKKNISEFVHTFPVTSSGLEIVAINFNDFQPVVSAIHNLISDKNLNVNDIKLTMLMPIDNQGGRNYLSYWVDSFFDEDSGVSIKIYLNYYENEDKLYDLISDNTDIVFFNDILKENDIKFSTKLYDANIIDTSFPMVYRALPVATSSQKREVEISQLQFQAASAHSQVVFDLCYPHAPKSEKPHLAVKELTLANDMSSLLDTIHQKAKWIVCLGMGIDKKILFKNDTDANFKIIGFTTGEGTYGEYNVTISAKNSMIEDIKKKLKLKIKRMFPKWQEDTINQAVNNCIKKSKYLDGISLLKALNPSDLDINNFMAYLMTNEFLQEKKTGNEKLFALIPLDMYRHWFEESSHIVITDSNSRPDFLLFTVDDITEDDKPININATIIECKFGDENNKHIEKASMQVKHGFEILKHLFSKNLESIEKKYWYSQIYRVLTFNEINLMDNDEDFIRISEKLMKVLDGKFDISWAGEIMTYWINSNSESITESVCFNTDELTITQYAFGQKKIMSYLIGNEIEDFKFDDSVSLEIVEELMPEDEEIIDISEEEVISDIPSDEIVDNPEISNEKEKVIIFDIGKNAENPENIKYIQPIENEGDGLLVAETPIKNMDDDNKDYKKEVNVFVGKNKISNDVISWSFSNPKMSNRHMLITGKSGQGKTYGIQGMMMDLAKQGIPVVIFDYTGGFVPDKMEDKVKAELGEKIKQEIVLYSRLNVNPFKMQTIDMLGMELPEKPIYVAQRISDIFSHVYKFGEQQSSAIYQACKNGLDKYNDKMNFELFRKELENLNTKESKSVLSKLIAFLDFDIFEFEGEFDWSHVLYNEGEVTVFQLSLVQSKDMQIAITEMILWDMWYYTAKNGKESKPFAVVLDEAQNLSFGEKAPTTKILTEGRKFGWSGWFATQFLKGQLKEDEINRLQQAALRIYFKPPENEIQSMAVALDPEKKDLSGWINQLKKLEKGECIIIGDGIYSNDLKKQNPILVKIPNMEDR